MSARLKLITCSARLGTNSGESLNHTFKRTYRAYMASLLHDASTWARRGKRPGYRKSGDDTYFSRASIADWLLVETPHSLLLGYEPPVAVTVSTPTPNGSAIDNCDETRCCG